MTTTTAPFNKRWEEIKTIWRINPFLYGVIGFFMGMLALPIVERVLDIGQLLHDSVPEFFGIVFTVIVIDRLYLRREATREEEALKRQLVMDAGSWSNEKAKDAVHQLSRRGWHTGDKGLLKGANLRRANLRMANLEEANLAGANLNYAELQSYLHRARLEKAELFDVNLEGADLSMAHLQDANLRMANLAGANLRMANLTGADLNKVNLNGADLFVSILHGANLGQAKLNEDTILPDGTPFDPIRDQDEQLEVFVKGHWYPLWMNWEIEFS